jgi:hypothetical protein
MAKGLLIGGAAFAVVIVVIVVVTVVLISTATSARPSPEPFVDEYLSAVSEGDAAAARAIDDRTVPKDAGVDAETFRSDAVLGGAIERIGDVRIEGSKIYGRESGRVTASYTLAGERQNLTVNVKWDDKTGGWALADGVFHAVEVAGGTSSVDDSVPFVAISRGRTSYLAYPGVYPFELAVSPDLLTDPGSVPTELRVTPGPDQDADTVYVQFDREPVAADLITTPKNG